MLNHFRSGGGHIESSEEENHIFRRCELAFLRSVLISRIIVGMLVANLRTKQNCGSDPVSPTEQVLGVTGFGSGALADDVVEVFVANGDVVVGTELPLQIIDD